MKLQKVAEHQTVSKDWFVDYQTEDGKHHYLAKEIVEYYNDNETDIRECINLWGMQVKSKDIILSIY